MKEKFAVSKGFRRSSQILSHRGKFPRQIKLAARRLFRRQLNAAVREGREVLASPILTDWDI